MMYRVLRSPLGRNMGKSFFSCDDEVLAPAQRPENKSLLALHKSAYYPLRQLLPYRR